jgi:hypothetical protein
LGNGFVAQAGRHGRGVLGGDDTEAAIALFFPGMIVRGCVIGKSGRNDHQEEDEQSQGQAEAKPLPRM